MSSCGGQSCCSTLPYRSAQYELPKLSAVAIAPPVQEERTQVRVSIFDHDGHKVNEYMDGKPVPLSEDGREEEVDE